MTDLWPHQARAVEEVQAALDAGEKRLCLTSPTGGGKTRIACALIDRWLEEGLRVVLYTNRRQLVAQTARVLEAHGLTVGVRAAGYLGDDDSPLQVASIQTESSRAMKRKTRSLHDAQRVLVDEAHLQTGAMASGILEQHAVEEAAIIGLTATPIGLGTVYDRLVVAGTNSELRACGALVPCRHFGPDEPDLKGIKGIKEGKDLTEKQAVKAIMRSGIFGRVLEWFEKLNPEHKPTILFAPGVRESIWFAEQFQAKGINAAHIDGESVWIKGAFQAASQQARDDVLGMSRDGSVTVLCNRFVLREGVDAPWLAHGIFATVFGGLQSYLQSGGRLLRSHPSLSSVTLQDHGGNWHRHGSLNADREWDMNLTAAMVSGLRADRLRAKKMKEPFRCLGCGQILQTRVCPGCGREVPMGRKSRPVVQSDGSLKELQGDIFKPRRICQRPNGPQLWERMYHRSCTEKGEKTFRAAAALFAYENDWGWPDPRWPLMPIHEMDMYKLVKDVPRERLVSPAPSAAQ